MEMDRILVCWHTYISQLASIDTDKFQSSSAEEDIDGGLARPLFQNSISIERKYHRGKKIISAHSTIGNRLGKMCKC